MTTVYSYGAGSPRAVTRDTNAPRARIYVVRCTARASRRSRHYRGENEGGPLLLRRQYRWTEQSPGQEWLVRIDKSVGSRTSLEELDICRIKFFFDEIKNDDARFNMQQLLHATNVESRSNLRGLNLCISAMFSEHLTA